MEQKAGPALFNLAEEGSEEREVSSREPGILDQLQARLAVWEAMFGRGQADGLKEKRW
jgi:hypothetical protein